MNRRTDWLPCLPDATFCFCWHRLARQVSWTLCAQLLFSGDTEIQSLCKQMLNTWIGEITKALNSKLLVYCKQLCLIFYHDYQSVLHSTKKTYERSHSIGDTHTHSITQFIRNNRDGKPSGEAEKSDKCIFLWKQVTSAAWISATTIDSTYVSLNPSTTLDLMFYKP
jgi:hypothetical protein